MSNYTPKLEHKFTFGLWTIGNKDGAFTSNDPKVRAYALQKTMHAIDLGAELGAEVYVFWGGREGVETDAAKDPVEAIKRSREAWSDLRAAGPVDGGALAGGTLLEEISTCFWLHGSPSLFSLLGYGTEE